MDGNHSYNTSILPKAHATNKLTEIKFTVVVIVAVLTLTTNQIIIYAFFKNFKMRTTTNKLVVNLCTADVIAALGDLVSYSVELFHDVSFRQFAFCRVSLFLNQCSTNAVVMAMVMISIDRYFNLVRNSLRRLSRRHVRMIVDFVWIYAFVTALPWDLLLSTSPNEAMQACNGLPHPYQPAMNIKALSYILKTTCILIPYLAIIYIFILVVVSTRRRRTIHIQDTAIVNPQIPKTVHSYGRSTVSAFLLFSLFLSFTFPFLVTIISSMITAERLPNISEFLIFLSFRSQGILLPIVYLIRNRFIAEFLYQRIPFCPWSFQRQKEQFTRFASGNTRNTAFVLSKPSSRRIKQAQRIQIFYTAGELSSKFTDIESAAENKNESQVVITREVIEEENDVLVGNVDSCVHKWIYRPKASRANK